MHYLTLMRAWTDLSDGPLSIQYYDLQEMPPEIVNYCRFAFFPGGFVMDTKYFFEFVDDGNYWVSLRLWLIFW